MWRLKYAWTQPLQAVRLAPLCSMSGLQQRQQTFRATVQQLRSSITPFDCKASREEVWRQPQDQALGNRAAVFRDPRGLSSHPLHRARLRNVSSATRSAVTAPFVKRAFDLTVILFALPLWLPVFLLTSLMICWREGRPVFFWQERLGRGGVPFFLLKFRTMNNTLDSSGKLLPDDQRLTQFGRWLRSTSLDELPEIMNVLKGEMSLVGPRPLLVQYLPRYSPRQGRRHEVKPGITGWAQINGRNAISWKEKLELDVWYVENRSFWLDLKILILTAVCAFQRRGITAPGSVTAPEFMGTES
jgi:sugar transferase EpsL